MFGSQKIQSKGPSSWVRKARSDEAAKQGQASQSGEQPVVTSLLCRQLPVLVGAFIGSTYPVNVLNEVDVRQMHL